MIEADDPRPAAPSDVGPHVFSIPAHRAFADALVAGLIRRHGRGPLDLARGLILLPNGRSVRTVRDAFVRASDGGSGRGLVLPRLVVIGDEELDEAVGVPLDDLTADPLPPAIAPLARRLLLARMLGRRLVPEVTATEAVRLAGALAAALDTLAVEEVPPAALAGIEVAADLQAHWQRSLGVFAELAAEWPDALAALGLTDRATRRAQQLRRVADAWTRRPPSGFVVAAGVDTAAPAVARLLRTVADLPHGTVVFAGLDLEMPEAEWEWLAQGGVARESHPQFEAIRLLDRMSVARAEVRRWPHTGTADANERRGRLVASAFAPAPFTGEWFERVPAQAKLNGVTTVECDTPAEEAQAIAIRLRQVLETPGARGALVTPDRALGRRVAALLRRWDVEVDDSAGTPLGRTPPGAFLRELALATADRFAPVGLLGLLKHPLATGGLARVDWLAGVRALDLRLRGVPPPAGLAGVEARLRAPDRHATDQPSVAWEVWRIARAALDPLDRRGTRPAADFADGFRAAAEALAGDELWSGPAGRLAADWWDEVERDVVALDLGAARVEAADWPLLLDSLMEGRVVRPPGGGHPRLAILGLIEARLAHVDVMIAGGLNEGVWPALPAPDPWLAPRIRRELDLPSGERRIGLAAHDLVNVLGAPRVVLTRAARSEGSPTVASRFWLRLAAMSGGLEPDAATLDRARRLDRPDVVRRAERPAPRPSLARRPKRLSVSAVDRLAADPFAFYADAVLRLRGLDGLETEPDAAWKGSHVHDILDQWHKLDDGRSDALIARARAFLDAQDEHPLLRALWEPRLVRALDWIATRLSEDAEAGRRVVETERALRLTDDGVELRGRIDRVDRLPDGGFGVVDYKTGGAPSAAAVRAGFANQLGLCGWLLEDAEGERAADFAYWTFRRAKEEWGSVAVVTDEAGKWDRLTPEQLVPAARDRFRDLAALYLTGTEAFVAKLNHQWARGVEYDQLMRLDEWWGRR